MSYKQWFDAFEEECAKLWQTDVTEANLGKRQIIAGHACSNLMFVYKDIDSRAQQTSRTKSGLAFRREAKLLLSEISRLMQYVRFVGNLDPGNHPSDMPVKFGDLDDRVDKLMNF